LNIKLKKMEKIKRSNTLSQGESLLKKFIVSVALIAWTNLVQAQNNSSYDRNSVPIGGSGLNNSAFGFGSMNNTMSGSNNTGVGWGSLNGITSGYNNTAIGMNALPVNTWGYQNTGVGMGNLYSNTTGHSNSGIGYYALYNNTFGVGNTALGVTALYSETGGSHNSAFGYGALRFATTSIRNTACGGHSLDSTTTGSYNTACGMYCLQTNQTGGNNTGLGYNADVGATNLFNATAIGQGAVVNASNKVRIGNTNVTVVEGPVSFTPSDERFKLNISENDVKGIEFISLLRPVVYNFDTRKFQEHLIKHLSPEAQKRHLEQDFNMSTSIRQTGFIAQEVDKAAQEVGYNFNGVHKPVDENDNYSLAYAQFVVPLVKAVQQQQKMIEELKSEISALKAAQTETGINDGGTINNQVLEQNEPNPYTGETTIKYILPKSTSKAQMVFYDLSGKQIKALTVDPLSTSILVSSDQLAPGMYIYSIVADGKLLASKRMAVAD
jgi:trimeric autotransporter adhesin